MLGTYAITFAVAETYGFQEIPSKKHKFACPLIL
jgi:hypothetical protein